MISSFRPFGLSMFPGPKNHQQPKTNTLPTSSGKATGDCLQLTFSGQSREAQLHKEALKGQAESVSSLLNQGVNPDAEDTDGLTALRGAACSGNVETIQALLDAGATVNHKAHYDKETALDYAVYYAHADATQALLDDYRKKGLDPRKDSEVQGKTLLHRMIEGSDYGITPDDVKRTAKALVNAGQDINQQGIYGSTPLTLAVGYFRPVAAEGLLLAGANPDSPNKKGQTPLQLARKYNNTAMIKLLMAHGATETPTVPERKADKPPQPKDPDEWVIVGV